MNNGEIIIYQTTDGNIKIDVRLGDETVWLTPAQMAPKVWYVGISDVPQIKQE